MSRWRTDYDDDIFFNYFGDCHLQYNRYSQVQMEKEAQG